MHLAERIRALRLTKGLSVDELARDAQVAKTVLYNIERGVVVKPRPVTMLKLSRALDVPLDELMGLGLRIHQQEADGSIGVLKHAPVAKPAVTPTFRPMGDRGGELLEEKLRLLLSSPLSEAVAQMVDDIFCLLPVMLSPPDQSYGHNFSN
jgi:transcriptional regulator with XRE-family HTH domain